MSHLGTFVVVTEGRTRVLADRWAGSFATVWFARGPANAEAMAGDFAEVDRLEPGEAGYLVDFPRKTALLYDLHVRFGKGQPGTTARGAMLAEVDLTAAESKAIAKAFTAGKKGADAFFAALRAHPPTEDAWEGWDLRWVGGSDAFREHLERHGDAAAKKVASGAELRSDTANAVDFLRGLQLLGPQEAVKYMQDRTTRKAQGLPEISPLEWREGRRS